MWFPHIAFNAFINLILTYCCIKHPNTNPVDIRIVLNDARDGYTFPCNNNLYPLKILLLKD